MEKKPVLVEINDLRDFVGGNADVTVSEKPKIGHAEATYPSTNGTSMCYYVGPSPDAAEDWIVIKGK